MEKPTKDEAIKLAVEVLRAKGFDGLANHCEAALDEAPAEPTPPRTAFALIKAHLALWNGRPQRRPGYPTSAFERQGWSDYFKARNALNQEMQRRYDQGDGPDDCEAAGILRGIVKGLDDKAAGSVARNKARVKRARDWVQANP